MTEAPEKRRAAQRVVFIGSASVGKTSLISRIVHNTFPESPSPTVSGHYSEFETANEDHPLLDLWDTAGMERYGAISSCFYRGAAAAVVVFDITNRDSFEALGGWIRKFNDQTSGASVILAGNKSDMDDERVVESDEIATFAQGHEYPYFEVSAKSGAGIAELMQGLIERMPEVRESAAETWSTPELKEAPPEKKGCC